jgi:hypothetical protein
MVDRRDARWKLKCQKLQLDEHHNSSQTVWSSPRPNRLRRPLETSKPPYAVVRQGQGYQDVSQGGTNHPSQSATTTDIAPTIADPTVAPENALKWLKREKRLCGNCKLQFRHALMSPISAVLATAPSNAGSLRRSCANLPSADKKTRHRATQVSDVAPVLSFQLLASLSWGEASFPSPASLGFRGLYLQTLTYKGKRNHHDYVFTHCNAQIRRTNCRNKTRSFSGLR